MKKALAPVKEPSTAVLKKELQEVFNRFIRNRDKGKGCIYCGTKMNPHDKLNPIVAAHYWPVSTSESLRFDELNVHGAHKFCNQDDNRESISRHIDERLGSKIVDELAARAHSLAKHTRSELQALITKYK